MTRPRFYTDTDLNAMDKGTLETIVEARGLDVTGSGKGGQVVVDDLRTAILGHQDTSGINPALEAIPEEAVAKRYRVDGSRPVFDHPPGREFDATLPTWQEALLVEGGALTILADQPDDPAEAEDLTSPLNQPAPPSSPELDTPPPAKEGA